MTERDIAPLLGKLSQRVGVSVIPECPSTNSLLKARAPESLSDAVLIAESQTGGRGRMGRSFYSPPGSGLYMSILTRPELENGDLTLLTPAAAVAVCGAIEDIAGVTAGIKWVNDVYVGGKKVCGILTETAFGPGGDRFSVVGIGVNLFPPPGGFPADIADTAGAVLNSPVPVLLPKLAAGIINRFFALLPHIPELSFVPEYRSRSLLPGRDIWVVREGSGLPARAVGVDSRCGLQVEYPDGALETLRSGEVTVRVR